ncbi:MAG: hypothetical protein SGJ20_12310 [Planctomycetota bacterium]|nr:hypothetical protein [Planctomycetota bacterium]
MPVFSVTSETLVRAGTLSFVLFFLTVSKGAGEKPSTSDNRQDYAQLLALFPEDRQAYGKDSFRGYMGDQPMTMGQVVSAEAIHYRHSPNDESRRRVRAGVRWLLDNADLDKDGAPGWGLPQPWDTWSDGTENPANHSYTITTAIVIYGLLDALQAKDLWNDAERAEQRAMLVAVSRRWCREIWSDGYGGGYFWYSPRKVDDAFGVNVAAMFLGSLTRLIAEQPDALTDEDRKLFTARRDAQAKAIVSTVERRKGQPFWKYAPLPNRFNLDRPNDLLHHAYTLWGIETYRDAKGPVEIPWTRAEAVSSMDKFWRDGVPQEYPQNGGTLAKLPARLWSVGMMLAFYAQFGSEKQAADCFGAIRDRYGKWPQLQLLPVATKAVEKTATQKANVQANAPFIPRQAAHVLYGLAIECYGGKAPRKEK